MKKSEMNFKDSKSLSNVRKLIDEADLALNDKSRIIKNVSVGLSAFTISSMFAGAAALAGPFAIVTAFGITSHIKNKKLAEEKQALYKKAVEKQNAIIEHLKNKVEQSEERIEYLTSLNELLQDAIRNLKHDLS